MSDTDDDSRSERRRIPEERGPFGRATQRRGSTRSKSTTAQARTKEDQTREYNLKAIDGIFGEYKKGLRQQEIPQERAVSGTLGSIDPTANASLPTAQALTREPTEVMLYGFGSDVQWAAIDFYEKTSGGLIYEDYDRHPPHSKYNASLSLGRSQAQRSLSQVALQKKNMYVGGDNWIKVTFDSPEAADRACYYSPHVVHGYTVYAERYRGLPPTTEAAIPANTRNANLYSPQSSTTLNGHSESSQTASSATATTGAAQQTQQLASLAPQQPIPLSTLTPQQPSSTSTSVTLTAEAPKVPGPNTLRIRGAKPVVLLPAEQALMPVAPPWQATLGKWPIVGLLFGGGSEIIGSQVPRKEDGSFDEKSASFYWRFWFWLDGLLGTDYCGIKGDD